MKKLNIDELFSIFSAGDQEIPQQAMEDDILHTAYVFFGLTVKGVENYFIMEQMYFNRYGETFSTVRDSIKLKYFISLMKHLERIDVSQSDTLYMLKDLFGEQSIDYALKEMIEFFEGVEMYENCAILMRFYKVFFPKNSWQSQD